MSDDLFAFHVDRLARRHHDRHDSGTVAEVTLQRWLTLRHRYDDPFDADLFDHVDATLGRMPPSRDTAAPHRGRTCGPRPIGRSA